ncbi:MAG: CrcB family protein [Pseudomonadota bacterium]
MSAGPLMWLAVGAGGAIGACARYAVTLALGPHDGQTFPIATFSANVCGAFAMGLFAGFLASRGGDGGLLRGFLGVGLLGAFTTYSTFSLEAFALAEAGVLRLAGLYIFGTAVSTVLVFAAGAFLVKSIL